ncbi:hypothetical protein DACRYDRAFT_22587 [Dacryopinax primogenitus]|uniref:Uncharacterized protein n=1 Tax=Dacryopinax primogenitus (strain DJM 731) TaxID=1858805 RepID=M5FZX6_DACPD|nr:uncharacterized protein DACRYDRAFT_22587 [Dacryopinax primogenitus]EJU01450.1 hypothetical protein DACRYDRAFT_22587 [Dacryopinax primogenitus]
MTTASLDSLTEDQIRFREWFNNTEVPRLQYLRVYTNDPYKKGWGNAIVHAYRDLMPRMGKEHEHEWYGIINMVLVKLFDSSEYLISNLA